MPDIKSKLRPRPCYHGVIASPYRIEPGLHAFATNFGNGDVDRYLFQLDDTYYDYLQIKQRTRQRRPENHYFEHEFSAATQAAVCELIVNHLEREHPDYFHVCRENSRVIVHNKLTGARIAFRSSTHGLQWTPDHGSKGEFRSGLDALAHQLQEDLAIISRNEDRHWLSAIHLCFPNHWCAKAKIGRGFAEVHAPVPHFESIAAIQSRLVNAMIERGPYVRFVWGLSFDGDLDHHPDSEGQRYKFNPEVPQVFVRMERQCILGVPEHNCALFTIRTYHYELKKECLARVPQLRSSIASMDDQTLRYKGIAESKVELLGWLDSLAPMTKTTQA